MAASLASDLRDAVARFVAGDISLRELRKRTIPAIYTIDSTADPDTAELADELILRFAEDDHGDWTEDAVRAILREAFGDTLLPSLARRQRAP